MTDAATLRLDKWLWFARLARTRSLAARLCQSGAVSVGGSVVLKPHHLVRIGDTVAIAQGRVRRRVVIAALGERRGPAAEARGLYDESEPPAPARRNGSRPGPRSSTSPPPAKTNPGSPAGDGRQQFVGRIGQRIAAPGDVLVGADERQIAAIKLARRRARGPWIAARNFHRQRRTCGALDAGTDHVVVGGRSGMGAGMKNRNSSLRLSDARMSRRPG